MSSCLPCKPDAQQNLALAQQIQISVCMVIADAVFDCARCLGLTKFNVLAALCLKLLTCDRDLTALHIVEDGRTINRTCSKGV